MRKEVNIVWLEDKQQDGAYKQNTQIVKELIEEKGYLSKIHPFLTINEARDAIKNHKLRVDFFISDFNLTETEEAQQLTGLNYLEELRMQGKYKEFFILYSKLPEADIQLKVIEKMKSKGIEILSNFTFISLTDNSGKDNMKRVFKKAVDISLARWDELNAFRGEYLCENAELESKLISCFGYTGDGIPDYSGLIRDFCNTIVKRDRDYSIQKEWDELRDTRNDLAHIMENSDEKGFYIKSVKNDLMIYESDLNDCRRDLIDKKERILKYFEKNEGNVSYRFKNKR